MNGRGKPKTLAKYLILTALAGGTLFYASGFNTQAADRGAARMAREKAINSSIKNRFARDGRLLGANWVPVSLEEAAKKALEVNLSLGISSLQKDMAKASVTQADASFDTQISLNGSYSGSKTFKRTEYGMKYFKGTVSCNNASTSTEFFQDQPLDKTQRDYCQQDLGLRQPIQVNQAGTIFFENDPYTYIANSQAVGGTPVLDSQGNQITNAADLPIYRFMDSLAPIAYIRYTQNATGSPGIPPEYGLGKPAGYYVKTIKASEASPRGLDSSRSYNLSIFQPLPYGMNISANQRTTHTQSPGWNLFPSSSVPTVGNYNLPWTSSISGSLSMPIPGTKNFGPLAAREVASEKAELGQGRTDWMDKSRINGVMLQVENAYWGLVSSSRVLEATISNHRNMRRIASKTEKMYDLQRVTEYGRLQVQSEVARVAGQEQIAWNNYVKASHTLNLLLRFDQKTFFLPTGYQDSLRNPLRIDLEEALAKGNSENPRIQAQQVSLETSGLTFRESRRRTRPDLSLSASVSASQSNSKFGYKEYTDSMGHLFDPDSLSVSGTLSYSYPLRNRNVHAAMAQARNGVKISKLQKRVSENQVSLQIKNAHAGLASARERIIISARYLHLAGVTLQKAKKLQGIRKVTEYELILKSTAYLEAKKRHILAQVDAKKAEAALVAAMGILGKRYNNPSSNNSVSHNRDLGSVMMASLTDNGSNREIKR